MDAVCSLVNVEGHQRHLDTQGTPERGPWEGDTCPWAQGGWQEAGCPLSFHFQEERQEGSVSTGPTGAPASNPSGPAPPPQGESHTAQAQGTVTQA